MRALSATPGRQRIRFGLTATALNIAADFIIFLALLKNGALPGVAHVFSFLGAAALLFVLQMPRGWRVVVRWIAVALMALFLRGGVLAIFLKLAGWHAPFAILPAI